MTQDPQVSQLIEQTLPLVKHIVFQVAVRFPRHVDREELARAGVLGLVQAAQRYDATKGSFTPFAAQRIRGAILDAVREIDWAPRSVRRAGRSLEVTTETLANKLGRAPTHAETAAALGMTPQGLTELQAQLARSVVLALDWSVVNVEDDDEITLGDVIPGKESPEQELENRELLGYLRDAVALLPERRRQVIEGYFFEGKTSEELAELLGVTVSRISQIRSEAFELLRYGIDAQYDDGAGQPPVKPSRAAKSKMAYAGAIADRSTWRSRLDERPVRIAI